MKIKTNNARKLIYKATSGDIMSKWRPKNKKQKQIDVNNKLSFLIPKEVGAGAWVCIFIYSYCRRRQLSTGAVQLSNEQLTKRRIDSSLNWQLFCDISYLGPFPQPTNNNNTLFR